jgi:hypothetical protein
MPQILFSHSAKQRLSLLSILRKTAAKSCLRLLLRKVSEYSKISAAWVIGAGGSVEMFDAPLVRCRRLYDTYPI